MGRFDDDKGTTYYCKVNKVYCGTKYSVILYANAFMASVLQILKNLVFKSSVLIIPQIMLIFSLQENTRGAPLAVSSRRIGCAL